MTANRQDAWSHEDDLLLAETVLRHIREGSTQLAAFEEVAEALVRTSAACGFRWNSTIRKKYEAEVNLAKKKRTAIKREKSKAQVVREPLTQPLEPIQENHAAAEQVSSLEMTNLDDVIEFLKGFKEKQSKLDETVLLKEENESLREKLSQVENEKNIITQDYRALLEIMERARKLTNSAMFEKTT
ncbi:prespore specific transcriptional activator RsfA [Bacillus sp. JCM 19045]|nr:prespore specific transcriptional activator RsfA [Bacillus sp. JCM 19045]